METDIPHYKSTKLAYEVWRNAEAAYTWSSNDYHLAARKTNYQAEWVRPAAYDLSVKQAKSLLAKAEYERKKRLFERINKVRFEPIGA